ncbi:MULTISPECIES: hypothetical protein [unclassified Acidiphilium]|uniref:hypothetical protein n=1 Tax=unclassified Acidiphilium TaxID=2617493 RepID=UPI000461FD91|nr:MULTISPECIES: hypothetical protein [unclassified Acidiphilium]OYV88015.1 MAG: mobilization protein [Acidiphilium sp. 21-68-69]OYW12764.1 MAG: mobilization protein [Acidiphilium sp. 37-67-22]KDM66700.1 hypothetical protein ACIDI_54c00100 [Acidiphilium sp. JA12-A1]HQT62067.1 mobilization protein [Acidiphilium sp.]HQT74810.1 mobilization protein [Acidiphilium sp.]
MRGIIYVGGNKGGVGKSMVAIALADHLRHVLNRPVFLIETDTANPDAAKCLGDELDATLAADTRTEAGWQTMLNAIEQHQDKTCVINAGARDNDAMRRYGDYLHRGAEALATPIAIAWVINDERDSLLALRDFLNSYPGRVDVIGNRFFDEAGTFAVYRDSKIRTEIEARSGTLRPFPILPRPLAAAVKTDRRSPATILAQAPLFERIALEKWRADCAETFAPLLAAANRT